MKFIISILLFLVVCPVLAKRPASAPPPVPVYALWNVDTGVLVDSKDDGTARPMASITKIMSAFVVLQSGLHMDEVLKVTGTESSRYIRRGMLITREKLLELALVSSDNLAARTLAETYPGGHMAFIEVMNETAKNLGMQNTVFGDSTGLLSTNRTTLSDLNKLIVATQNFPIYTIAANTTTVLVEAVAKVKKTAKTQYIHGKNTNIFAGKLDIISAKTGYTSAAGRCLAMLVNMDGTRYLLVVMGAGTPQQRKQMVDSLLDKIK